jgi:hypothetical protein
MPRNEEQTNQILQSHGLKVRKINNLWWVVRKSNRPFFMVTPTREPHWGSANEAILSAEEYIKSLTTADKPVWYHKAAGANSHHI